MKALLASLAVGACLAALPTAVRADVAGRSSLRIASEGGYAPWNATDASGKLVGFEIELGRELCRRLGVSCEFVALDWDGLIPALQSGRADAIMATMSITPQREQVIAFAGPYANEPSVFVARTASGMATPADARLDLSEESPADNTVLSRLAGTLTGKTVGVLAASTQSSFMTVHLPAVAVRAYDKLDNAGLDLAAGRIDAVLAARSAVEAISRAHGAMVLVGPSIVGGELGRGVGVGLRKSDETLKAAFTKAIAEATADGTVARLSAQHFGFDVSVR